MKYIDVLISNYSKYWDNFREIKGKTLQTKSLKLYQFVSISGSHGGDREELSVLWDKKLSSLVKVNQRFGGIYRLHLQDR
jgi:hypothetical protein